MLGGSVNVPSYGCIESVWKCVFEETGEVFVVHLLVHVVDNFLDEG